MLTPTLGYILESFYEHINDLAIDPDSVEEYIHAWVTNDQAWKDCRGSHPLYLAVVAAIFATWHDARESCHGEEFWDSRIPWRVTRAFKDDHGPATQLFDSFYFQSFASYPGSTH